MAIDPNSPLNDPLLSPPETMPGPSNPWLACAGSGGSRGEGGGKPPAELGIDLGVLEEAGVNWWRIGRGVVALGVGYVLLVNGISLLVVGAVLLSPALAYAAAFIAGALIMFGVFALGFGAASLVTGIDPVPANYQQTIELPAARRIVLDPAAPDSLVKALAHMSMVERLSTAEIDLVEHARAAGAAGDEAWYRHHMERLYRAEVHLEREIHAAAETLEAFVADQQDLLQQAMIEPGVRLRDRMTALTTFRPQLHDAGLSDAEINNVLLTSRLPGPVLPAIEKQAEAMIEKSDGTAAGLLRLVAKQLGSMETLDKEAFGIKP